MRHTLSVLVENKAGVLAKIAGLFGRRAYNMESLAVGTTERPDISRMTIVVDADEREIEQVMKQLHKVIEVLKISNITEEEYIERELVLIKVQVDAAKRSEVMQIVDVFRARIVDISPNSLIIEATGEQKKLDAIQEALRTYGIKEIVRTGELAMVRGLK
ncbi:MAG: acetolactate synthase small subunit [Clostridia bacterium]|nr:acetolactate synthase small subunit [Clostridia bacterium]